MERKKDRNTAGGTMKAVGIIAEYHPFHKGHAYHIKKARELSGADFVLAVMSPDFVQRGEPAIADKYCRTAMALAGGADVVLELPVRFACASAEYFAEGAVSILNSLGCISHLCFGCETPDLSAFQTLADFFRREPALYQQELRAGLKSGATFPKARESALKAHFASCPEHFSEKQQKEVCPSIPGQAEKNGTPQNLLSLLTSPNNILGLEYTKALQKLGSPIQPLPLQRKGSGYHSLSVEDDFCSASALRSILEKKEKGASEAGLVPPTDTCSLSAHIPPESLTVLKDYLSRKDLVSMEDFSAVLHYRLLSETDFTSYLDVGPELSSRILKLLPRYAGAKDFALLLCTKQLTQARVRRGLLHILLGITTQDAEEGRGEPFAPYARLLGFKKEAAPLLRQIQKNGSLPLITKPADAKQQLSAAARHHFERDVYASHLYQLPASHKQGIPIKSEYTRSPIIW